MKTNVGLAYSKQLPVNQIFLAEFLQFCIYSFLFHKYVDKNFAHSSVLRQALLECEPRCVLTQLITVLHILSVVRSVLLMRLLCLT